MENLNNLRIQRLTIFGLVVSFIILQTFFPLKGTGYFLVLPSIFMLLTYKSESLGYGRCFTLGLINDLFCMQILGLSSLVFLGVRFIKLLKKENTSQNYWVLLSEYLVYAYSLLILIYSFTLFVDLQYLSFVTIFSVFILQLCGFFVCYFLWMKIFEFLDE